MAIKQKEDQSSGLQCSVLSERVCGNVCYTIFKDVQQLPTVPANLLRSSAHTHIHRLTHTSVCYISGISLLILVCSDLGCVRV